MKVSVEYRISTVGRLPSNMIADWSGQLLTCAAFGALRRQIPWQQWWLS